MTGILEMFAALSEPDEFDVQVQLELFAWARSQRADRNGWTRLLERKRDRRRGHRDLTAARKRWRDRNRQQQAAYRAANREKRNAYFRARRAALRQVAA